MQVSPGTVTSMLKALSESGLADYVPYEGVALTDAGELLFVKASGGDYEVAARYRVADTPTWAPPALINGGVLIKAKQTLAYFKF